MTATEVPPLPVNPDARIAVQQAVQLHEAGDFKGAVPFYIRAVNLAPNDPDILYAAGIALGQSGKSAIAVDFLKGALRNGRNTAEVWSALGMAFVETKQFGNAERAFKNAVQRNPNDVAAWISFGHFAYAGGSPKIGADRYTKAVAIPSVWASERFAQSLIWLLRGQYRLGWKHYESRRLVGNWRIRNTQHASLKSKELPVTDIRAGMHLLLEAEQGQGDAVQFARFIAPFCAQYKVTVTLQSHDALQEMLAVALEGVCPVIGRAEIVESDGWLPLMSLPYAVKMTSPVEAPAPTRPFGLAWSPRERTAGAPLRVFVHAKGNAAHSYDFDRSVPDPEHLLARFHEDPFIEVVTAPFKAVAQPDGPTLFVEPTWRETVDLLLTCDRCLTVDTGLAHVAASLGVPTDVMIPAMPEWRWGLSKTSTPWYPSVRLWRRTHTFEWDAMLTDLHTTYKALANE